MKSKEGTQFARFEADRYYRPGDPALDTIASRGTLATWRWAGRGPRYTKFGHRILYRGSDLEHVARRTSGAADDEPSSQSRIPPFGGGVTSCRVMARPVRRVRHVRSHIVGVRAPAV